MSSILQNRPLETLEIDMLTEEEMEAQLIENKRRFLPEITDENPSSQFYRFIKYMAMFPKKWIRSFAETILNQAFLPTASSSDAIKLHARANNYIPTPVSGASVVLTCTLLQNQTLAISYDKDEVRFQTKAGYGNDPVVFECAEDSFVVPAGSAGTEFFVSVVQGKTVVEEVSGTSNGESFQQFATILGLVVSGSEKIEVQEYIDDVLTWVEYSKTDDMLLNDFDDRVYEVIQYTEDGILVFGFGNGDGVSTGHGRKPADGMGVRVSYRTIPEDEDGNVAADTIISTIPKSTVFSVTNVLAADGWEGMEDIPTIRWKAERQPRIHSSIHKIEDFVATGESLDGVGRCYSLARIFGENTIAVYFVDSDGDVPTGDKVSTWEAQLESLNATGEVVCGSAAIFQEFSVSAEIKVADNYVVSEVITAVETAIETRFSALGYDDNGNRLVDNGMEIYPALISAEIMQVAGVMGISMLSPVAVINIDNTKLPYVSSITITEV